MPSFSRPNILLCIFDSLAAIDIDASRVSPGIPILEKLQQQSVVFTAAYTTCPESSPARASLFTGLDPSVHGVWSNGVALPSRELTFPQHLMRTGYTNWLVGRRQLAGVANWTTEHSRPDEFNQVEWAHGPLHRSRQNAYLNWLQKTVPDRYAQIFPTQADPDNTSILPEQFTAMAELPDELSFNHWVGLRTCELMSSTSQPFLAVAAFSVGTSMGAQRIQEFDVDMLNNGALQQADAALGRILAYLVEHSLLDNTVVVVTAGRGNAKPGCADSAMHESAIKVPLIVRLPARSPEVVDFPVSIMDIAPTILQIAGSPPMQRVQGTSLLAMLSNTKLRRNWVVTRLRAGVSPEPNKHDKQRYWQTALRVGNMKLIVHHGNIQSGDSTNYRMFDLLRDPYEQKDLSGCESYEAELENMVDLLIDARCALEDRTEPRIAKF